MSVVASDIKILYSTKSGSAGHSLTQTDPTLSLGKYASTSEVPNSSLGNVFPAFSGTENANSEEKYSCVFVWNSHASLSITTVILYRLSQTADGLVYSAGLDPIGAVPIDDTDPQATTIADQYAAPAGVSFLAPTTRETGIEVGTIGSGECVAVWLKAAAQDTAAVPSDSGVWRIEFDTL